MKPNSSLKTLSQDDLLSLVTTSRKSGKKIGLCHGVFDLLHPGHFEHISSSARECDVLIVSITGDKFVNKGPGRPFFNEEHRSFCLASIDAIDAVTISQSFNALSVIDLIKPDVYFKGPDYSNDTDDVTGMIKEEREAVIKNGGYIHITQGFTSSSSRLINMEFSPLGTKTQSWIETLRPKYSLSDFSREISKIESLRVLVVGEVIIDEYSHVETLGKVNKDPILAFNQVDKSFFLGGAFAIAKNVASWCKEVTLVSYVGDNWTTYDKLVPKYSNLNLRLFMETDRSTIRKHRFISNSDNRKLFEYYDFKDDLIRQQTKEEIKSLIEETSKDYDVVIICDYGHGLIGDDLAQLLSNVSPFVALNVQQNAGNRGFNDIRKYENIDFFTLNVNEIQWTMKSRLIRYEEAIEELMGSLNSSSAILTLGSEGLLAFKKNSELAQIWIPAFSTKVVDKVGAGDAIFAMSSLLHSVSCPLEIVGMVSSLVAADEISKFGHTDPISLKSILKQVKSILA